eukprot:3243239-Pyramimonas_sp.AAC.1
MEKATERKQSLHATLFADLRTSEGQDADAESTSAGASPTSEGDEVDSAQPSEEEDPWAHETSFWPAVPP